MNASHPERDELRARVLALIDACADGSQNDRERDALITALAQYQRDTIPPYARFLAQRRVPENAQGLDRIAALPTDAFRFARLSTRGEANDVRCFVSSGTTQQERSKHVFSDLTLYDHAARAAARYALFPDCERMRLVVLAPSERDLPVSSLSYMLSRFIEWFGDASSVHVWHDNTLDLHLLSSVLVKAEMQGTPVALLGTSFGFVHAIDELEGSRFHLPPGSRIMQTGGFKARARELVPEAMRALLTQTFEVEAAMVVAEYGMTELSSQLYENTLRAQVLDEAASPRHLWIPGWLRAVPVDPETLLSRDDGAEGLLRVDDAANLDSVCCIQTADRAARLADGVVVAGRAAGAIARGCSITADALLGDRHGER